MTIKYRAWYEGLMTKARNRAPPIKFEKHHVQPRSLGGTNNTSNIVKLTYREHFLAHWLLTKFLTGHDRRKMFYALHRMGIRSKVSWQYDKARRASAEGSLGRRFKMSPQAVLNNRLAQSRPEVKAKISAAHRGKIVSTKTRALIGAKGRLKTISLEQRAKISLATKGKPKSAKTRALMSVAATKRYENPQERLRMSRAVKEAKSGLYI